MTIKAGDRIPEGKLGIMTKEGPGYLTTQELFKGKKVVLFSVPGAFTPTCSNSHLPGYIKHAAEIKAKGVDTIACMAVNDAFVMDAWGKDRGVGDKVLMLADGNGEFTRALGLELDASGFGMGKRSQRFSMVVDNGIVKELNVEAPREFKVSTAECVLGQL
ncbi:MAG: peroxiredoxin [Gammaproteobacteria bacterium PRO9]|nr:peroxiredoxin [Gammaproteobacteria bacterium PRO9]